ncbi:MAG: hypothetical protein U5M53_13815 [Rhodoferax sp.]|nr:hypothetical protein [Rhodoferax sp.]
MSAWAGMYSKGEQCVKESNVSNPEFLSQLIAKASTAAGNDSQLAKLLEVSRGNIADWRACRRNCPVADVALMAEIAGLKPEEWTARALVAQYEGTSKGDKLYRALGKALVVTGAVVASSGAAAHQFFLQGSEAVSWVQCVLYTMYIFVQGNSEWFTAVAPAFGA